MDIEIDGYGLFNRMMWCIHRDLYGCIRWWCLEGVKDDFILRSANTFLVTIHKNDF